MNENCYLGSSFFTLELSIYNDANINYIYYIEFWQEKIKKKNTNENRMNDFLPSIDR